jgi:hypothetical protein
LPVGAFRPGRLQIGPIADRIDHQIFFTGRPTPHASSPLTHRFSAAVLVILAAPATAQKPAASKPDTTAAALVGTWSGNVTVPFGDSTIVAPVTYAFVKGPSGLAGTAAVPGQGSGTISNVVRTGARVQFRVTVTPAPGAPAAPPRKMEHDATLGPDGTLDGLVSLDGQPMAKFKVKKP